MDLEVVACHALLFWAPYRLLCQLPDGHDGEHRYAGGSFEFTWNDSGGRRFRVSPS